MASTAQHAQVIALGRANGMGEADSRGSYVLVSVEANGSIRTLPILISEGNAEVLIAELQGALKRNVFSATLPAAGSF